MLFWVLYHNCLHKWSGVQGLGCGWGVRLDVEPVGAEVAGYASLFVDAVEDAGEFLEKFGALVGDVADVWFVVVEDEFFHGAWLGAETAQDVEINAGEKL